MKVVVTGATGFIGRYLLQHLASRTEWSLGGAVRRHVSDPVERVSYYRLETLDDRSGWADALKGAQVVVHTAARVHQPRSSGPEDTDEYRRINVGGSVNIAMQAVDKGAKRFVFLSSVKVHGESSKLGHPFSIADDPSPADPYSVSKWEAEIALRDVAQKTGIDLVIVRPPLVYGPGVRANFLTMLRWISRGWPLPLGDLDNRRSFLALENLADLICACCSHPAAAGQTFLASDDEDLSTTELLQRLGDAIGRPAHLFRVPEVALCMGAALLGRRQQVHRLLSSLQVDITDTRRRLDWSPSVRVDEGLIQVVRWFQQEESGC